jgi:hypothetical protein
LAVNYETVLMVGRMHERKRRLGETVRERRRRSRWLCIVGFATVFIASEAGAQAPPGAAPSEPGAGPSEQGQGPAGAPQPAAAPPAGGGAVRPPPGASELAPGPVKRLILDLQKSARDARQPEAIVDKPVREAIRAAERARGARAAGDSRHGGMLERLAKQWVATGEAVVRAVKVEALAAEATQEVQELTTKLERAEALLVEQQARLGRLRSELEAAEADLAKKKAEAAGAEDARLDRAGGRKGRRRKTGKGAKR